MMKILFVGRSTYHFSYYESVFRALLESGAELSITYDAGWSSGQSDAALKKFLEQFPQVSFKWSVRRSDRWRRFIFPLRELRTYASYLSRKGQSKFYGARWRKYLPHVMQFFLQSSIIQRILKCAVFDRILAFLESRVPADKAVIAFIKNEAPDVLLVGPSNMRFSEEVEYIKAGKRLRIPTVLPVLSWDNLSTKGLLHIKPDLLLAWNQAHAQEALEIHGIPMKNIAITGSPFFDKWFEPEGMALSRSDFIEKIGLKGDEKYLLYLGSSSNIATDETWIVENILSEIKVHPDESIQKIRVVIRPHPSHFKHFKRLEELGAILWPKEGCLPELHEAQEQFYNTVNHAELILGVNTSGMIDATIMNKPCAAFVSDQYKLTQTQAVHFTHLIDSGAIFSFSSASEVVDYMLNLQDGLDVKAIKRKDFLRSFVRPNGFEHSAGECASQFILSLKDKAGAKANSLLGS